MKKEGSGKYIWASLRISMAFIFLWAFFDKLLGLGFATARESSWINGGSPTMGFLTYATKGPLSSIYQSLAGHLWVDILFMSGLLLIGLALLFGIGLRIAAYSGTLLFLLMWSAALFPANNPIIDDHIIYALVLLLFPYFQAGDTLGQGLWWKKQKFVKKNRFLE